VGAVEGNRKKNVNTSEQQLRKTISCIWLSREAASSPKWCRVNIQGKKNSAIHEAQVEKNRPGKLLCYASCEFSGAQLALQIPRKILRHASGMERVILSVYKPKWSSHDSQLCSPCSCCRITAQFHLYMYILLQLVLFAYPFVSSATFVHTLAKWSEYAA